MKIATKDGDRPLTIHVSDAFIPLARADYAVVADFTRERLDEQATELGRSLFRQAADDAASTGNDAGVFRRCAKKALSDTTFDMWWVDVNNRPLDIRAEIQSAVNTCLSEAGVDTTDLSYAEKVESLIEQYSANVLQLDNNDVAGLSNWLNVVNWYYVPQ